MSRCLNCGLNIDRPLVAKHRHILSSLTPLAQVILAQWLQIPQLPLDSYVCRECFTIISQSETADIKRQFGHTIICSGCGQSLLRQRYHSLPLDNPLIDIILSWNIYKVQRENLHYVCHPCWQRAKRLLLQNNLDNEAHHEVMPAVKVEVQPGQQSDVQLQLQNSEISTSPKLEPSILSETPALFQVPITKTATIVLPHYKRASNTSRHCIYSNCRRQSGRLIPLFIKTFLLREYNYYVPIWARVCKFHLFAQEWNSLPENSNFTNVFSSEQLEDLLKLTKTDYTTLDFEKLHEIPNHLCQYLTGLTVAEFHNLLEEIDVNNIKNPKTALAIYLTKLKTGDSNQRLATLFNIPRSTLETKMNKIKTCLLKKRSVPLHIGLQGRRAPRTGNARARLSRRAPSSSLSSDDASTS